MAVEQVLQELNIPFQSIELGEVTLLNPISEQVKSTLEKHLTQLGFDIINDKTSRIIEKIKTLIVKRVHTDENKLLINLSDYISTEFHYDYTYLSKLFSETEGITIEKYFIAQKIEKIKELILYDELSLSEIAFLMNYSSVAYLSKQFKQQTGLTPTFFKNLKKVKRKGIEDI